MAWTLTEYAEARKAGQLSLYDYTVDSICGLVMYSFCAPREGHIGVYRGRFFSRKDIERGQIRTEGFNWLDVD